MVTIALLLSVACATPPSFGDTGEHCGTYHAPSVPCGCSETISFDPVPEADFYEALRREPDGSTRNVGSTEFRTRIFPDENGAIVRIVPAFWIPAAYDCVGLPCDPPPPGISVFYRFRACKRKSGGTLLCSSWSAKEVEYARGPWLYCVPGSCVLSAG